MLTDTKMEDNPVVRAELSVAMAAPLMPNEAALESKQSFVNTEELGIGPATKAKLLFKDVTYDCKKKRILDGVSGGVLPGHVLAIMGASGSGKSTLLDVLANRKIKGGRLSGGSILINGSNMSDSDRTNFVGYVAQDDALLGGFSVRETFWFTARLIYGYRSKSSKELSRIVEDMINVMGLNSCANTRVGNPILRGISGGQKRRVSIGIALLARHPILLLDEPTSGLDSIAAFAIMDQLKKIAQLGHAVVATIHLPSSAIFSMFDSLMLLSAGREVYFGGASDALTYFEREFGAQCPDFFNPADFLLDVISQEFSTLKQLQAFTPEQLGERYDSSDIKKRALGEVQDIAELPKTKATGTNLTSGKSTIHAGTWEQTLTLLHRGTLNLAKNPGLILVRLIMYAILAVAIGLAFSGSKGQLNDAEIQEINATLFYSPCLFLFMSCAVIPFYHEEKFVFFREHKNGLSSVTSYVLASVLCSLPGTFLLAILTVVPVFFMVGLNNFGKVFLWWWSVFLLGETSAMFIAMPSPHYMIGLVICCGLWGSAIMVTGFLILISKMTWAIRWLSYSLPNRYIFNAAFRAQYESVGAIDSPLFTSGQAVLDYFDVTSFSYQSFWVDWAIVLAYCLMFVFAFAGATWYMVRR